jgi:hypothetical protein
MSVTKSLERPFYVETYLVYIVLFDIKVRSCSPNVRPWDTR